MSFKHPVYIDENMPFPMLIGLDCLWRLDAKISYKSGELFARVKKPKPYNPPPDKDFHYSVASLSGEAVITGTPPRSKPPGKPPEVLSQIDKVIDQADALTNERTLDDHLIQGIATITPSTNVSELRSFLGVCNYSCQFVEHYADIARPLTTLLKDVAFEWAEQHQQAMNDLKATMCSAPCLARPDCDKRHGCWLCKASTLRCATPRTNVALLAWIWLRANTAWTTPLRQSHQPASPPQTLLNHNHHYYDQSVCADLPTVYVDGSAFQHGPAPGAGVGVVWVDGDWRESQCSSLGERTSQFAEVAGIVIVLRGAEDRGFRKLVICTDSDYTRLSFLCHLPSWKSNGFQTANRKPVKHEALFRACDILVTALDMHVYWRKVKGHSRAPGPEKELNDLADSLAKRGATEGPLWVFDRWWLEGWVWSFPDQRQVCVVTRAQVAKASTSDPTKGAVSVGPACSDTDLVSHQSRDPAISRMIKYISDPKTQLPTSIELDSVPELRSLFRVRSTLRMVEGLLMHAAKPPLPPVLVTPKPLRRAMITQAHDSPSAGHKGVKATFGALSQVAYWPGMRRDTPDDTAKTTAILLMNHVFARFGLPMRVDSDRGTHFTSEVMRHLWKLLGVKAKFHISHRPQSSGQVERVNRTVISMLKKYVSANHPDWDVKLPDNSFLIVPSSNCMLALTDFVRHI
nr:uncharacterized protein LOC129156783 [Nothobranchius furzeri]